MRLDAVGYKTSSFLGQITAVTGSVICQGGQKGMQLKPKVSVSAWWFLPTLSHQFQRRTTFVEKRLLQIKSPPFFVFFFFKFCSCFPWAKAGRDQDGNAKKVTNNFSAINLSSSSSSSTFLSGCCVCKQQV